MKELTLQTKNLKLAALTWGNKNDYPILALHGWLDNAASFVPIAEFFRDSYLVSLDLPGHGKSEHRKGTGNYHIVDYAQDVLLAADALGFENFSILGHSLGAIIACMIAAGAPHRVSRIALIDGIGPLSESPEDFPKRFRTHFEYVASRSGKKKIYNSVDEAVDARFNAREIGSMKRSSVQHIVERSIIETDGGYTWRSDSNLTVPSPIWWPEDHVLKMLEMIQCDVRLVKPEDGNLVNRDNTRNREKAILRLEIEDIDGGHHVHMDHPNRTALCLQSFFNSDFNMP